jgi:sugar phosphate isomerase/epimerase
VSPFRLGLCSVTFRSLSPDDVVAAARAAGIEGIEWGGDVHVPPGDTRRAAEVAARTADAGVACPSYGAYLAAGRALPELVASVLETAVALGAPNVRVWCPFGTKPGADEGLFARAATDLAAWSARADDVGLTLSLEFHVDTLTESAESTARLLDAAGRPPNLFTYWQPVAGQSHLDEAAAVQPDVSHVHVFHWTPTGERLPLAEGTAWPALLECLAAPNRWRGDRFAFLEFVRDDDPAQLIADAKTLRSWS